MKVVLEDGSIVNAKRLKSLGFVYDASACAAVVSHGGREFMAVKRCGTWGEWIWSRRGNSDSSEMA